MGAGIQSSPLHGIGLVIGGAAIALAMAPALLYVIREKLQTFRDWLSPLHSRAPRQTNDRERLPERMWLAVAGVILILVDLLAYISN
jgi:hypothetical protein